MRLSRVPDDLRLRVLVAEDHDDAAVCAAVEADPRLELLDCVEHAAATVARTVELAPDVLVLDTGLEGDSHAAAIEIRARMPAVQIVVTYRNDDGDLIDVLASGASAYVPRAGLGLTDSIAAVGEGEVVLTRSQAAKVVEELRDHTRPRRRLAQQPELTAREWQVLDMMNHDLPTSEIAERLVLSPVTIRSHARSIRNKLNGGRHEVPHR